MEVVKRLAEAGDHDAFDLADCLLFIASVRDWTEDEKQNSIDSVISVIVVKPRTTPKVKSNIFMYRSRLMGRVGGVSRPPSS